MREHDIERFYAVFDAVQGLYPNAKPATVAQREVWFRALAAYPLADVRAAFDAHVKDPQRGRFAPMPADIIGQLEGAAADDGRPGAEEAWAIAVRAADEAASVVWTDEAAQAWGIAQPVMAVGDKVGARMAFKEAYERLVTEARAERRSAAWAPSLGHDAAGRDAAIAEAVERGQLRRGDYPQLAAPVVSSLVQLLEGPPAGARSVPQSVRERLARQREELVNFKRPAAVRPEFEVDAAPMVFTPISADCLPPGMRSQASTEAEYAAHAGEPL